MKRKEVFFLLAMLLVGTSVGGFAYPSNCYAATAETESSSEQSIYSLANHYFKIKSISNGKYLLGNKAGYEAQADTADSGMTFYFKASDLRNIFFLIRIASISHITLLMQLSEIRHCQIRRDLK